MQCWNDSIWVWDNQEGLRHSVNIGITKKEVWKLKERWSANMIQDAMQDRTLKRLEQIKIMWNRDWKSQTKGKPNLSTGEGDLAGVGDIFYTLRSPAGSPGERPHLQQGTSELDFGQDVTTLISLVNFIQKLNMLLSREMTHFSPMLGIDTWTIFIPKGKLREYPVAMTQTGTRDAEATIQSTRPHTITAN